MDINNPASRLFSLLSELKHYHPSNIATREVLARVFGTEDSPAAVMHAVVELHNLLREVVHQARSRTSLPSVSLIKYVPQIESAIAFTNLDAGWQTYNSRITPEVLVVLDIAAHIEGVPQDQVPSSEEVKILHANLQELFDFVENTSLDPQFKRFILEQIEHIRRCLAEYRITGAQGFMRYLETLIGQTTRNRDVIKRQSKRTPTVMSKFAKVLEGVKVLVGLTEDGTKLLGNLEKMKSTGDGLWAELSGGEGGATVPEIGSSGDSV